MENFKFKLYFNLLQPKEEIFVMDIVDKISSDILAKTLKNASPEDKVGYRVYWIPSITTVCWMR